jgi:hypothetical protein
MKNLLIDLYEGDNSEVVNLMRGVGLDKWEEGFSEVYTFLGDKFRGIPDIGQWNKEQVAVLKKLVASGVLKVEKKKWNGIGPVKAYYYKD